MISIVNNLNVPFIIIRLSISIVHIADISKMMQKILIKEKLLIKVIVYMYYNITIRLFS